MGEHFAVHIAMGIKTAAFKRVEDGTLLYPFAYVQAQLVGITRSDYLVLVFY